MSLLWPVINGEAVALPTGYIGDTGSQSGLAAFSGLGANSEAAEDASSFAWTAVGIADADTSGYAPAVAIDDATAENPNFTADGPCTVVLTRVMTGADGSTVTEHRTHKVNVTAPAAALAAVSNQNDLAPVALNASGSTGTGLVYTWSIRTQPTTSSAVIGVGTPNDDQHKSITLDIGSAGMWRVRVSVADTWGRVSYTERGFRIGDTYGRWRFNPLLSIVTLSDPSGIAVTPVDAGGGVFNYGVNSAGVAYKPSLAAVYAMALSSVTLADGFRVEVSLDADPSTVDGVTLGVYVGDGFNPIVNGVGVVVKGTPSGGQIARGYGVADANPSFTNIVCTQLQMVTEIVYYSGARAGVSFDAIADGAWNVSVARIWDTSVPAAGTAYLFVSVGAFVAAVGAIPAEIWIKVLPA